MQTVSAIDLMRWLEKDDYTPLIGAEQGFNERADVVYAADGTDLNDFWAEIQRTLAIRNADKTDIIASISYPVTGISEEVGLPSEVEFEQASEYGQPVGIKGTATRLFRGFDFHFWDLAIRYTWMYLAEADQNQLRMNHNLALEADVKLRYRQVMKRLFNPLNSNGFTEKNEPVTIYAAYNGDGEVPPSYEHRTFTGTHNHYTITGNTTVTPANLDNLANQTGEHGYTLAKGYRNVLWVNKQEADVIRGFRTANGAKFDFVADNPAEFGAIWQPNDGQYIGGPQGKVKGQIGVYGPFHVVEEGYVPPGYLVSIVTGGQNNLGNPIGIREHGNAAYRGLKVIPGQRSDYPLIDSFYRRGMGTGMRHRGAVAIMQVKASGNYTIPAAYDASVI